MAEAKVNANKNACAHCGAVSTDAHFCSECGKIQPVAAGTDYFAFFGLPRHLLVDETALEKDFYSLSRQLHPDYFMNATGAERRASIDRSSMLNDAYRTLRDRIKRAQYLLQLEGYKEAEKKAPPDLLEEVFELNMQIEELKAAKKMGDEDELGEARAALESALQGLKEKLNEIDERLYTLFGVWDAAVDSGSNDEARKAALDRMSEALSHRSYIRNLVRDITEEL
jgi:molecular chaperone HscB